MSALRAKLRAWILGFGAGAHVMSPRALVEAVVRELDAARLTYALVRMLRVSIRRVG